MYIFTFTTIISLLIIQFGFSKICYSQFVNKSTIPFIIEKSQPDINSNVDNSYENMKYKGKAVLSTGNAKMWYDFVESGQLVLHSDMNIFDKNRNNSFDYNDRPNYFSALFSGLEGFIECKTQMQSNGWIRAVLGYRNGFLIVSFDYDSFIYYTKTIILNKYSPNTFVNTNYQINSFDLDEFGRIHFNGLNDNYQYFASYTSNDEKINSFGLAYFRNYDNIDQIRVNGGYIGSDPNDDQIIGLNCKENTLYIYNLNGNLKKKHILNHFERIESFDVAKYGGLGGDSEDHFSIFLSASQNNKRVALIYNVTLNPSYGIQYNFIDQYNVDSKYKFNVKSTIGNYCFVTNKTTSTVTKYSFYSKIGEYSEFTSASQNIKIPNTILDYCHIETSFYYNYPYRYHYLVDFMVGYSDGNIYLQYIIPQNNLQINSITVENLSGSNSLMIDGFTRYPYGFTSMFTIEIYDIENVLVKSFTAKDTDFHFVSGSFGLPGGYGIQITNFNLPNGIYKLVQNVNKGFDQVEEKDEGYFAIGALPNIIDHSLTIFKNSKINITSNVVIKNNSIVSIEEGVEINISPGSSLIVEDGSKLIINGHSENKVIIKSSNINNNYDGIQIYGSGSDINYCDISNGNYGFKIYADTKISNTKISKCGTAIYSTYGKNNYVPKIEISNNSIDLNNNGLLLLNSNISLLGNVVNFNNLYGIYLDNSLCYTFKNNKIMNNALTATTEIGGLHLTNGSYLWMSEYENRDSYYSTYSGEPTLGAGLNIIMNNKYHEIYIYDSNSRLFIGDSYTAIGRLYVKDGYQYITDNLYPYSSKNLFIKSNAINNDGELYGYWKVPAQKVMWSSTGIVPNIKYFFGGIDYTKNLPVSFYNLFFSSFKMINDNISRSIRDEAQGENSEANHLVESTQSFHCQELDFIRNQNKKGSL